MVFVNRSRAALDAAHDDLLEAAKALRELDRVVERMSEDDLRNPRVHAEHFAAVLQITRRMDAAIATLERLSLPDPPGRPTPARRQGLFAI